MAFVICTQIRAPASMDCTPSQHFTLKVGAVAHKLRIDMSEPSLLHFLTSETCLSQISFMYLHITPVK